jgi:hypothetical protein
MPRVDGMTERYVWRGGRFVSKATGKPMKVRDANAICMPQIMSDIEDYQSPIDDMPVRSRSGQRYDLAKNDCVLAPPSQAKFDPHEYRSRKAEQAKARKLS